MNAWLAAQQSDAATEHRELELPVSADPADATALARLAELTEKDGRHAHAADLGDKKVDIDRLLARYRETARPATALPRRGGGGSPGRAARRRFEARAFLTIAMMEEPARDDLRHNLERFSATPWNRRPHPLNDRRDDVKPTTEANR